MYTCQAAHGRRHLLQAAEALQVTVQMDTHSTSHVNDISQQLSNTVNNGQLQASAAPFLLTKLKLLTALVIDAAQTGP